MSDHLHQQAIAAINAPCETAEQQRTHDRLAEFDRAFQDGHTKECALQMVFAGYPQCECGMIPKWVVTNKRYKHWLRYKDANLFRDRGGTVIPQQIFEKVKQEYARSLKKHGKWKGNYTDHEQSEAIRDEFSEWYAAYVTSDIEGEHGEINELIHLMNVAMRRIMFLTGEDQ